MWRRYVPPRKIQIQIQFGLWRVAAFVSSPIHLFDIEEYYNFESRPGSLKVFRNGTIRWTAYAFLFVIHCNQSHMLYHFRDIVRCWWKIKIFSYPLNITNPQEKKRLGIFLHFLQPSKICLFVLTECTNMTDTQTPHDDIGRTCIASCGKNVHTPTSLYLFIYLWSITLNSVPLL